MKRPQRLFFHPFRQSAQHRSLGTLLVGLLLLIAASGPLTAQPASKPTVTPDPTSQANTSLQMSIRNMISDLRNRLINTVSDVSWPILPQDDADLLGLTADKPIVISNKEFIRWNAGPAQDLPENNPGAHTIFYDMLDGNKNSADYLTGLVSDASVDPVRAAQITLDRQRVIQILRDYGGAQMSLKVNGTDRPVPELIWEFLPYRGTLGSTTYYRFRVNVVARNANITLNPADGTTQTLRVVMDLLPDPNMPPVRPQLQDQIDIAQQVATDTQGGVTADKAKSAITAAQAGAGELNPLLLALGVPSVDALTQQAGNALLTSGRLSLVSGLVRSGLGGKTLIGVNAQVSNPNSDLPFGVTGGIVGSSGLYLGPSISLGDGALLLSGGVLYPTESSGRPRGAFALSLDLSRLLFGKPAAAGPRNVAVTPQDIHGLYTSKAILAGDGALVLEGTVGMAGRVSPATTGESQPFTLVGKRTVVMAQPGSYNIFLLKPTRSLNPIKVDVRPGVLTRVNLLATPEPGGGGPPSPPTPVPIGAPTVPPQNATLRVQVLKGSDTMGYSLLNNALVQVYDGDALVDQQSTGADGWANFDFVPESGKTYTVVASLKGHKRGQGSFAADSKAPVILKLEEIPSGSPAPMPVPNPMPNPVGPMPMPNPMPHPGNPMPNPVNPAPTPGNPGVHQPPAPQPPPNGTSLLKVVLYLPAGSSVGEAQVHLIDPITNKTRQILRRQPDGHFEKSVPPGKYILRVWAENPRSPTLFTHNEPLTIDKTGTTIVKKIVID